ALAKKLGVEEAYTEGRDEMQWLRQLYAQWRAALPADMKPVPEFDAFWEKGSLELEPTGRRPQVLLQDFRADPGASPLKTPSGRASDRGTSSLAQGSVGQLCLVEIERFSGEAPVARLPGLSTMENA